MEEYMDNQQEAKAEKFREIWNTLSKVDVSEFKETKMNLDYLSWSRAWFLLCEKYPEAEYEFMPSIKMDDNTMEVCTSIRIGECVRMMSLPIMDYKNQPIITPDSRQVSDNRMRCLVKNMAMFGLGISLYMGFSDDLPDEDKDKVSEKTRKKNPVKAKKPEEAEAVVEEEKNIPSKEVSPPEQDSGIEYDEDWAKVFIEGVDTFMHSPLCQTKQQLTNYYKANGKDIGILGEKFPDKKAELDQMFVDYAETLPADSKERNAQ